MALLDKKQNTNSNNMTTTSIILKLLAAMFVTFVASHFVDKQINNATTLQKLRLLIATSMFCKFATIACIFAIMVIAIKHSF